MPKGYSLHIGLNKADAAHYPGMPELKAAYGYPMVLLTIATVCSFLYWRFKRNGWL